jgi:hypothetical protein
VRVTSPDHPDPGQPDREGTDREQTAEGDPTSADEVDAAAGADDETARPGGQEPDWVRRRRLDAAFGDGAHSQSLGDRWYRDQVPPHHG